MARPKLTLKIHVSGNAFEIGASYTASRRTVRESSSDYTLLVMPIQSSAIMM
ncbi:uncharacterized protein RCC_06330 [Ramularia collo-cygni]|uniref:Uncharacterized protein n=1 Tax=Ramularia collo-cygni TaxID=112498 RepID=A0A2D3V4U4_9PEZI|nr:uncharacterized protein RCC_06330 [Ramularia collo-cygni]CZT20470.1 uncharacterized protein RCC_06330 [Ramularia collo-cygni]